LITKRNFEENFLTGWPEINVPPKNPDQGLESVWVYVYRRIK
jgi:hypothetical protein